MTYKVSVQRTEPRLLAVVRDRMAVREVPSRFGALLSQVYSAAKAESIALDGQNVFVYHAGGSHLVEVEFGVGVRAPFAPVGRVTCVEAPSGDAATTTHWGDYGALGAAHEAVIAWCEAAGHALTGTRWEVYGHWDADPEKCRTDVYYLLQR